MPTALNAVPSTSATMSGYDSAATPALALSDIMHHMSPSPVPPDVASMVIDRASGFQDQAAAPDPLTEADVLAMRQRLAQMILHQNGSAWVADSNLSSREKELVDMVLRLTSALPMDTTQLHRQAETIANLTSQRDYIVREIEDERERWRAEREVWDRTAEALLTQRTKPQKSEDAARQREIYESETRALRDRLHDTQRRLSHLEAELLRLKPLLLMQPYSKGKYRHHNSGHQNSRHGPQTEDKGKEREVDLARYPTQSQDKGKGREMDPPPNPPPIQEHSRSLGTIPEHREFKPTPPAFPSNQRPSLTSESHPPSTHHHHRRRSRDRHGTTSKSSKRRGANRHTPLSSDAYAEHLLLAAKRVGRLRATHVSGLMQHAEREKELLTREQQRTRDMREQERLERERLDRLATGTSGLAYYRSTADGSPQRVPAAPHTPKKQIHYGPSANNTPIVFVHTLSPPVPVPPPNFSAPHIGGSGASRGPSMALTSNPPTPLDSLLDAARMMDDGAGRKANGKGRALEDPESPLPKRRRVSGAGRASARPPAVNGEGGGGGRPIPTKDRVRSALDVLADQAAAAFDDPEQSDRRAAAAAAKGTTHVAQATRSYGPGNERKSHQVPPPPAPPDSAAASTSSTRTRPRGRAAPPSVSSTSTAASSVQSASSASGRPLRNAVKRHSVLSPELDPERAAPPPAKSASTRGTSRPRGRPRTNTIKARVISPPQARVIAPAQPYVMGRDDTPTEAASPHLSDQNDAQAEEQLGEPLPVASAPPVTESGRGYTEPLKSEQEPGSLEPRSCSQPLSERNEVQKDNADPTNGVNVPALNPEAKSPPALPNDAAAISALESALESATDVPMISSDTPAPSLQLSHQQVLQNDSMVIESAPFPVVWPSSTIIQAVEMPELTTHYDTDADADADADEDADAEADIDEDQDAEGEQEDDVEGEASDFPSRSKSPPPPDPPPPGSDSGPPPGNDDSEPDADADADAEGEMDLEEGEEAAGSSHASGMQEMMQLQLHHIGHGLRLEAATAPMASCYRSALKGKLRTAGGLTDMCAKKNDRYVLPGEVPPGISLEKSSVGTSIKWGNEDIFLLTVTLNDPDVPIGYLGHSISKTASSWYNATAADPSIDYCEPPFRPHVPSIHPIIEDLYLEVPDLDMLYRCAQNVNVYSVKRI